MIKVEGLSQKYDSKVIYENVSFRIEENEVCAILGRNGAGKTTLIHSLLNLLPFPKGEVSILGHNVKKSNKWKKDISYLPEKFQLYPQLTVEENLVFFNQLHKGTEEDVKHCLSMTGMSDYKNYKVKELSKGMLQRVGLSLAFLGNPSLIILDEPTSGIDPFGRKEIIQFIKQLKSESKTILFTTHHLSEVESLASHVLWVEDGKVEKYTLDRFKENFKEYGDLV